MKHKVILDTNAIYSTKSFYDFFGNHPGWQEFLKIAEIIVPDMVIEEIKNQKRVYIQSEKESFLLNIFHSLKSIREKMPKDFDVDNHISDVYKNAISHEVIWLKSETALESMKKLCLEKSPPFEKKDDSGFKDAYIYFTILDYLKEVGSEKVYFITSDSYFAKAFEDNPQVVVVKNYIQFMKEYSGVYFDSTYFIQQLGDYLEIHTSELGVGERWLNSEKHWILEVIIGDNNEITILVEIDSLSKEFISDTNHEFFRDINNLIGSVYYQETHLYISKLKDYMKYFTYEEIHKLLEASMINNQIRDIAKDEDVEEFLLDLYQKNKIPLDAEVDEEFKKIFNIEDTT